MSKGSPPNVLVFIRHFIQTSETSAMAINIVDLLKSQLGGQIAGQLGKQFGENEQAAQSGISALIPTILGGLLKQVSAPGGPDKLNKTLNDGGYDGSLLDNISGMLTGGGTDSLATKGGGLVSMIFGDKISLLAPILAKLTGMKASTITALIPILLPLVMSFLGKQKKTMGLDANGLANLLTSQKDTIAAAMPAGISDAMGLGSLGIAGPAAARTAPAPAAGGGGMLKVLIPVVLLGAVGYGCYKYIFDGIRPRGAAGNVVIDAPPEETLQAGNDGGSSPGLPERRPGRSERPDMEPPKADDSAAGIALPAMAEMPDVKSIFESMSGALGKVTDVESATAALPELESMQQKLSAATTGFSAMPDMLKSKLSETMKGMLPDLEATISKVMAIPGVKEILQPVIDKVMEHVKTLTA
jgi:Bacterial protein of unknown function (DUF937)